MTTKTRHQSVSGIRKLQELVHDVSLQLASYRQMVQTIGTLADNHAIRRDLENARKQCLKSCETTKCTVLPQLKSETHEGVQSSEFTKQASQFIGCLSAFVTEMRRYESLITTFPQPLTDTASASGAQSADGAGGGRASAQPVDTFDAVVQSGSPAPGGTRQSAAQDGSGGGTSISKDINEAERMLETLENLITVHFSTKDQIGDKVEPPKRRGKGCKLDCIFSNFKTSYA